MSRTKELKTNPENNISMFDLFSLFVPEGKSKYVETFLRIMKKTNNIDSHVKEVNEKIASTFDLQIEKLNEFPKLHMIFFYRLLDAVFEYEDIKTFQKFCQYNERGIIKQNDLSKYNNFDDIKNAVSVADLIAETKELEKQVLTVHDDDEWLLLRPLTYASSKKYGSNTKWCTTQENNPEYFNKYSSKGVLIYCINKQSGYKVASFYSLQKDDPEFSFWDQKDKRIDSLETKLPDNLRVLIREISTNKNAKTNKFLLSDEERLKEDLHLKMQFKSGSIGGYDITVPEPAEQPVEIANEDRIVRAVTREREIAARPVFENNPAEVDNMPSISYNPILPDATESE